MIMNIIYFLMGALVFRASASNMVKASESKTMNRPNKIGYIAGCIFLLWASIACMASVFWGNPT